MQNGTRGYNPAPKGRTATRTIAAYNASPKSKASADYVCDGVNDEIQIRSALKDVLNLSNAWTHYAETPVIAANFAKVWFDGTTFHAYGSNSDHTQFFHFTSSDGKTFVKDVNTVMSIGPGTYDNASIEVPNVWKEGANWYMLYRGNGINTCYATSTDGLTWTKYAGNPVIANQPDPAGIIKIGTTYFLYANTTGGDRFVQVYTSTDLTTWVADSLPAFYGDRYCSEPFKYNGLYYLLVSAYYDARRGGVLELYSCADGYFREGQRSFLGVVVLDPTRSSVDTPSIITDTINRDTFPNNELWCYYSKNYTLGGIADPAFLVIEPDIGAAIAKAVKPRAGKVTLLEGDYTISLATGYNYAFSLTYGTILDCNNATIHLVDGTSVSVTNSGSIFVDKDSSIKNLKLDGNSANVTGNQVGLWVSRGGLAENVEVSNWACAGYGALYVSGGSVDKFKCKSNVGIGLNIQNKGKAIAGSVTSCGTATASAISIGLNSVLDNCDIYNNILSAGASYPVVYLQGVVSNSRIYNNGNTTANTRIVKVWGGALLKDSQIYNNTGIGVDVQSLGKVSNCQIYGNGVSGNTGIYAVILGADAYLTHCDVYSNYGGGVSIEGAKGKIQGGRIYLNGFWGAYAKAYGLIDGVTLWDNKGYQNHGQVGAEATIKLTNSTLEDRTLTQVYNIYLTAGATGSVIGDSIIKTGSTAQIYDGTSAATTYNNTAA